MAGRSGGSKRGLLSYPDGGILLVLLEGEGEGVLDVDVALVVLAEEEANDATARVHRHATVVVDDGEKDQRVDADLLRTLSRHGSAGCI